MSSEKFGSFGSWSSRWLSGLGFLAAVGFLGGLGCDSHEHGAEPGEDACEHLEGGPVVPVTAGAAESAPILASSHTRYDITLGGDKLVRVPVGEAAEYYFFFASAATLVVKDADGAVVAAEKQGSTDAQCGLVGAWFVFDLEVGTYTLEVVPPGSATEVKLVFFPAGSHEH